jgi:hypothetical protein
MHLSTMPRRSSDTMRILVGRWLESIQNWCLSHLWLGDTRIY